jgi:PKD repeat protein
MNKRKAIPLALLIIFSLAFLMVPVAAAGLTITDGLKINATDGATSPVITITDAPIAQDGTITIDVSYLNYFVSSYALTNANVVINDTAALANWTGEVVDTNLILTSTEGATDIGETITVTFTGATGNPWVADTMGEQAFPMYIARSDGLGDGFINFVIETAPPTQHGLGIVDGAKIITTDGATTSTITITESPITQDGTITIDVSGLNFVVAGGTLSDANVEVNDTAANATWTGAVAGNMLTLTSTGGNTTIGETVNVTLTGSSNPWIADTGGLDWTYQLTATRSDGLGFGYFNFVINIAPPPPVDLVIADGAKITKTNGTTSPTITITGSDIATYGTISLDVSSLNAFVASGTLTDANVIINDTAANATWTSMVAGNTLTLTSSGGPTVSGETVTMTFTGSTGNPWITNTGGNQTAFLTATRTDGRGSGTFNFVIETAPPPGFTVLADFSASPTSDVAPLMVTFTDKSTGSPSSWNWSFGDGSSSILQNPVHTYTDIGLYTVSLTASNEFGSDVKTRREYIAVINIGREEANATINGLTVTNCIGPQTITVDTSILQATLLADGSVLEIQPPFDRGLKNITIYAQNGIGFGVTGNKIVGKPTSVHLETKKIVPSSRFSDKVGTNASFTYSIDASSYPCGLVLNTKILEGVTSEDDFKFRWVASNNSAFPIGTAYTTDMTRVNLPSDASIRVIMSVDPDCWSKLFGDATGSIFIWGLADNGDYGQILNTTYLYTDPVENLNYYAADAPSGLSTFGLSSLTGNNNPFQIIAFVATEVISDSNNPAPAAAAGGGGGGPNTPQVVAPSVTSAPVQIKSEGTSIETAPMETAPAPEPTILISSKSSMQTNVEMYGWLFGMIAQNPVTLVILGAAIAMVAYFGWWKRRL